MTAMFAPKFPITAATVLFLLSAISNGQMLPIDQFFKLTTFPNEQFDNVTRYLKEAAGLATDSSIHQYFQDLCITQQLFPKLFYFPSGYVEPFSPFDNLFFVGHSFVSSWAYNTTEGLVLIDTLDNPDEVDAVLLPDLEKFGFQGSDIKHVIITHEHYDHYGGAKYLQDRFAPTIYASEKAWDNFTTLGPDADPQPPARDKVVADGDTLTFGGVDFHIVLTPGHTPGTLSLIFPVDEKGKKHLAGLSGGTATPTDQVSREQKIQSQYRFAEIAREKGVDTLISNHQIADHALFHSDLLKHRTECAANPFVVGVENFEKYMKINALCSRVIAAREGMNLQV